VAVTAVQQCYEGGCAGCCGPAVCVRVGIGVAVVEQRRESGCVDSCGPAVL
jgi:hypothetical protein